MEFSPCEFRAHIAGRGAWGTGLSFILVAIACSLVTVRMKFQDASLISSVVTPGVIVLGSVATVLGLTSIGVLLRFGNGYRIRVDDTGVLVARMHFPWTKIADASMRSENDRVCFFCLKFRNGRQLTLRLSDDCRDQARTLRLFLTNAMPERRGTNSGPLH
jgi:hypothetical protein